jgi:hypothetical protein
MDKVIDISKARASKFIRNITDEQRQIIKEELRRRVNEGQIKDELTAYEILSIGKVQSYMLMCFGDEEASTENIIICHHPSGLVSLYQQAADESDCYLWVASTDNPSAPLGELMSIGFGDDLKYIDYAQLVIGLIKS